MQLRAWNHLAVFRHDWAVWLQLNRGPREEGRSQVGTLGWVGDAISKSWFQITKFPFKLSTNVAFSLPPADTKRPLHEYKGTWSPQGLFSRITFNLPLYVGGVGAIRNVRSFLGLDTGMVGFLSTISTTSTISTDIYHIY